MGKRKKCDKLVIGIDQSYTATGYSIAVDGELVMVKSTQYKALKSRTEKRRHLANILHRVIPKCLERANECTIICERIRTFSGFGNKQDKSGGLRPQFLIMSGAMLATIVDVASEYGIEVYSVDTRAWKSKVVGNSKARNVKGKRDAKSETVEFIQNKHGFDLFLREKKVGKNKGEKIFDDDAADSACIALYGFIPKKKQNLKLEE